MDLNDKDLIKITTKYDGDGELIVAFTRRKISLKDVKSLYKHYCSNSSHKKLKLPDSLGWCADGIGKLECESLRRSKEIKKDVYIYNLGGYLG